MKFLNNLGGYHSEEDFYNTKGEFVEPISCFYRNKEIFQLPPNTQGVISLLILKILNNFDVSKYNFDDPERIHLIIEAAKMAYFYRNKLSSSILANYYISDISSDRTELKIKSTTIPITEISSSANDFILEREESDYFV